MIAPNEIEEIVPVSHPEARRLLGIAHCGDPDQVARRMIRDSGVPHLRIGRRIRLSLPALQRWAAQRIADSVKSEEAQGNQVEVLKAAA
jgi:hypothetical protein